MDLPREVSAQQSRDRPPPLVHSTVFVMSFQFLFRVSFRLIVSSPAF